MCKPAYDYPIEALAEASAAGVPIFAFGGSPFSDEDEDEPDPNDPDNRDPDGGLDEEEEEEE